MPQVTPNLKTIDDFNALFSSDKDCLNYLMQLRFPPTFRCPKCHSEMRWIQNHKWCSNRECSHKISGTSGTLFSHCRLPLTSLFRLIWLFTSKEGVSASSVKSALGLKTYKTGWIWLHKLRTILGNDKYILENQIVLDEIYIDIDSYFIKSKQTGRQILFGRSHGNSIPSRNTSVMPTPPSWMTSNIHPPQWFRSKRDLVLILAEKNGRVDCKKIYLKKIMEPLSNEKDTINRAIQEYTAKNSIIYYEESYSKLKLNFSGRNKSPNKKKYPLGYYQHIAIRKITGDLRKWLCGKFGGGYSHKYIDNYLNEFAFRFNNRVLIEDGMLFYKVLEMALCTSPITK